VFRNLLLLFSVFTMSWVLRRLFNPPSRTARPGQRPQAQPRPSTVKQATGKMVRDRFCNTFIPESGALTAQLGGEQYFFCSEGCRSGFMAQHEAQQSNAS